MSTVREVIGEKGCTEEKIELILLRKDSSGSFNANDALDSGSRQHFLDIVHSIASFRRSHRREDDEHFYKRCRSLISSMKIMCRHNEIVKSFPLLFDKRLASALNSILCEVAASFPDDESYGLFMLFMSLLQNLLVVQRGQDFVATLLLAEPLRLVANAMSAGHSAINLTPDVLSSIFGTLNMFVTSCLIKDLTESIADRLQPETQQFLTILFSSLHRLGDVTFQSSVVLSCVNFCDQSKISSCLRELLKQHADVRETKALDKVCKAFKDICNSNELSGKIAYTYEFLRLINLALRVKNISSFSCVSIALNNRPLSLGCEEIAEYLVDVNYLSQRLSFLLAGNTDENMPPAHVHVPIATVKQVQYWSASSRSEFVSMKLSQLPSSEILFSNERSGSVDLTIRFSSGSVVASFLQALKTMLPAKIIVENPESPAAHSNSEKSKQGPSVSGERDAQSSSDGKGKYATAFISTGTEPIRATPRNKITYSYKGDSAPINAEVNFADKTEQLNKNPTKSKRSSAASKPGSDLSVATKRSLDTVFSPTSVFSGKSTASKKPGSSEEARSRVEDEAASTLPDLTSSVFSAKDYLKKLDAKNRDKTSSFAPTPTVVLNQQNVCPVTEEPVVHPKKTMITYQRKGLLEENMKSSDRRVNATESKKTPNEQQEPPTTASSKKIHRNKMTADSSPQEKGQAKQSASRMPTTATRKQPVRQAVIAAEKKKQMTSFMDDDAASSISPAAKKRTPSNKEGRRKRKSSGANVTKESSVMVAEDSPIQAKKTDISKVVSRQPMATNEKPERKSAVSVPLKKTTHENKAMAQESNLTDIEQELNNLPPLAVEEGELDEAGRLVQKKRLVVSDINCEHQPPTVKRVLQPIDLPSPPLENHHFELSTNDSVEMARGGSLFGLQLDRSPIINETPINDDNPEQTVEKAATGNQTISPLQNGVKTIAKANILENSLSNVPPRNPPTVEKAAKQQSNTADRNKTSSTGSWSESFPGENGAVRQNGGTTASVSRSSQSTADRVMLSSIQSLVGETLTFVSKLSTEGNRMVGQIARVNENVRVCCESLRTLEQSSTLYSNSLAQLKQFETNLILAKQLLKNSAGDQRKAVETALIRGLTEIGKGQICVNAQQMQLLVADLMKSLDQDRA